MYRLPCIPLMNDIEEYAIFAVKKPNSSGVKPSYRSNKSHTRNEIVTMLLSLGVHFLYLSCYSTSGMQEG